MHYINHNIKFYREYKRYTQQDIADMLGTTVGRVKSYEQGKAVPLADMMIAIADMMNISLDTLFKVKLDKTNYGKQEARIEAIERKLNVLLKSKTK